MDAQEYDPRPEKRRKRLAAILALSMVIALIAWFWLRHWPEKRVVDGFFREIESGSLDRAYGFYTADANWQQHPVGHPDYTFAQFRQDWGPGGEYGAITNHHIECATDPPRKSSGTATGVIVVVRINHLPETRSLWVEKTSKSITVSPLECTPNCGQCEY